MAPDTTLRPRAIGSPDLPGAFSSFVGRASELSELPDLLARSRLLTLVGAPGIGKSRLALEGANRLAGRFSDGARLVELAAVGDPALLPQALAAALGVAEVPGLSVTDALLAHLRERHLLLVLDNCEHLINPCADLVARLLSASVRLSIMATSREPLAITGETVLQVPPLALPEPDYVNDLQALADCEAVRLFVERAGAVQLGFQLGAEHAPPVAEIVRRLDGIPLAIELAAARVGVLTPAEIAGGLDHRFTLLTRGSRSALPRHQTLGAALDWSHELLDGPERTVLARLSVFRGGFDLEACEGVCAGGQVADEEVFHLLARLAAKSLVVADTANATSRYRLLETIRAYAGERLADSGDTDRSREAHARFYLALAERAEPELTGPRQAAALRRLDGELGNLRGALEWSLEHGRAEWGLRLAAALILFWRQRCRFGEGRDLLAATIAAGDGEDGETSRLRARALWGAGFLTFMAGEPDRAQPALQESLAVFRELGDAGGCARALLAIAQGTRFRDHSEQLARLEESIVLARAAADTWCLSQALGFAGYVHSMIDDLPPARELFAQGVAVAREADDRQGLTYGQLGLGRVARLQGDHPTARALLEEVVTITRELGDTYIEANALWELGELARDRGDYARARDLFEQAAATQPKAAPFGQALALPGNMATIAHATGDLRGARALFEQALELIRPWGTSIPALLGLGEVAADEGNAEEAQRLFEQALAFAREGGNRRVEARALGGLGHLARGADALKRADKLHHEALELQRALGAMPRVAQSLEAIGGLAAASGRHEHGARLLAAADALRERNGYARTPRVQAHYDADRELAARGLSAAELESAVQRGAAMTIDEALAQACRRRRQSGRPAKGWPSLTGAERQVVGLVAEGLPNHLIAERLFITRETVKSHLSHIYAKLGVSTRLQLEVRRHQDQPQLGGLDGQNAPVPRPPDDEGAG